jgi:hypothetical protein
LLEVAVGVASNLMKQSVVETTRTMVVWFVKAGDAAEDPEIATT